MMILKIVNFLVNNTYLERVNLPKINSSSQSSEKPPPAQSNGGPKNQTMYNKKS